jgi:hypothetical protein
MAKDNKGLLFGLLAAGLYALYSFSKSTSTATSVTATGAGNAITYTSPDGSVEVDINQTFGGSKSGFEYSVFVQDASGFLSNVFTDSIYSGDGASAQATSNPDYAVTTTPVQLRTGDVYSQGVSIAVLNKSTNSIVFSKTLTYTGGPA